MMDDRQLAPSPRRGVSLLELVVALAIMGLAVGLTGLSMRTPLAPQPTHETTTRVVAARSIALRTGRRATVTVERNGRLYNFSAYPDGSVLGDSVPWIDALTGRPQR